MCVCSRKRKTIREEKTAAYRRQHRCMAKEEFAHGNAVCVFLSNTLSLGLALLEWVLVLELGAHTGWQLMVLFLLGISRGSMKSDRCRCRRLLR